MDSSKTEWRSFIKISVLQGRYPAGIWRELKSAYGKFSPSYETVRRWCNKFKSGDSNVADQPKSGRPNTGVNESNISKVADIIDKDRRVTVREVVKKSKLSLGTAFRIIKASLGLVLRCARWVPKLLTPALKKMRKSACTENLYLNNLDSKFFLDHIVTGDETYLHYYEPETKRMSMQWLSKKSPAPTKAMKKLTNKKVMCVVFWDRIGILLIRFFRKGATMTGQAYAKILAQLKRAIENKRGDMWDEGVYLIHDNAPTHTSRIASSAIDELGFIKLDHPPYSPDLAPSDYYLFGKLKNFLRKRHYKNDSELEKSASQWLLRKPPAFYSAGISALPKRWEKCIKVKGDYVEK